MRKLFTAHKILSLIIAAAIILSGVPVTAVSAADTATAGVTATDNSVIGLSGEIEPDDTEPADAGGEEQQEESEEEPDPEPVDEDDGNVATSGVTVSGDGETCVCTAFQSDPDCPVCKDDATQCAFYYCVCEAECGEDSVNTDCPVCKDDYTMCVQAVEVPGIAPMALVDGVLTINVTADLTTSALMKNAITGALGSDEPNPDVTTLKYTGDSNYTIGVTGYNVAFIDTLLPNLRTLDLSDFAGTFNNQAFQGCKVITTVKLPHGAAVVGYMFSQCTSLTTVYTGDTPTPGVVDLTNCASFEQFAFRGCTSITTVKLSPSGTISSNMFTGCTGLTTIYTGSKTDNVVDLSGFTGTFGNQAFQGCTAITAVKLSATVTVPGNAFANCTNLKVIAMPATQPSFGDYAFYNVTSPMLLVNDADKAAYPSNPANLPSGAAFPTISGTLTLNAGDTLTLNAMPDASLAPAVTYQWYKDGALIDGETGRTYSKTVATTDSGSSYACAVSLVTATGTTTYTTPASALTVRIYGISLTPVGDKDFGSATFGYGAQTAHSVTVTNAGNQATGALTVALGGTNKNDFTLSTGTISSISVGGSNSFTVVPKTGLAVGTYTATVTVSGSNSITASFDVSFEVTAAPTYGISLDPSTDKDFGSATFGYGAQTAHSVTVTNTGNQATGALTVALGGTNQNDFTLSTGTISSISVGGNDSFTIVPKTGLAVGTYTATVTVSGSNSITASFEVSFEVTAAPTYGISLIPVGNKDFGSAEFGYGAQTAHSVTVTNTGNQATGALTVALSGTNQNDFTLSTGTISSIAVGGNDSFTIVPKTGLAVGTYTAAVTVSGGNSITASFEVSFEVTAAPPVGGKTDAEKVADDKAALTFESIKGNNTAPNNITGNLTLPAGGSNGSFITWSSNDTSAITNGGAVTRPDYGAGDVTVTLTATITNGTASDSKTFTLTVKAKEQKQTTVETKPNTPQANASGLDALFTPEDEDFLIQNSGASIEIKLVVKKMTAVTPDEAEAIGGELGGKTLGVYLDATLFKTVSYAAGNTDTTSITGNVNPVTITIELPAELQNMPPYSVIRVHNGVAEALPTDYDPANQTITFTTNQFSTYAIAYTPPNNPPSRGGGSSPGGGNGGTTAPVTTYWIEAQEAKTMAKMAKEQELDNVRSRRSAITGIRKDALLILSKAGLSYRHDTVEGNAVQVRVYIADTAKAAKDILVSGYVKGNTVAKVKTRFEGWFQNKVGVISFDQQGDFGMVVKVAARVDLSDMDVDNLYFYSYDRQANKCARIKTEYRIDAHGYLHFATILAGDIIISSGSLSTEAQANGPALTAEQVLQNPNTGGDSLFSIYTGEVLKLENWDISGKSGVLEIDLPGPVNQYTLDTQKDGKPSALPIGGITAVMLLVAITLWAVIPRKDDPLVSVEEYRKKH